MLGNRGFPEAWSCLWVCQASFLMIFAMGRVPHAGSQHIINLISMLTIWWCPRVESSLMFLEEGVCYDQCILLAKRLVFALLHSAFQGQICLLLQVFLDFLLLHSSPLEWKGHLFWVLVLKALVGLHRTVQLQLLQRYWLGHRLG